MFFSHSGGNKRKLSTAIALVGDPPIIFLVSNCLFNYKSDTNVIAILNTKSCSSLLLVLFFS